MSEAAAAPVAAAEPSAATEKSTTGAPEGGAVTATPPPRTVDDDFDDVLKKAGGLTYKANGKEKKVTASADLRRLLSRLDGNDSAIEEANKKAQQYEKWQAQRQGLQNIPARERMKAFDELLGEGASKSAREAFEEQILEEAERSKQMERLSPQERHLRDELEKRDNELKGYKTQQEQAAKQQQQEKFMSQVQEIGAHLEKLTVAALTKAKISPDAVPLLLPALAREIERNERLGLGVDENELADRVATEHDNLGIGWMKSKPVPDLADALEASGMSKELMNEFARRIKARLNGTTHNYASNGSNGTVEPKIGVTNGSQKGLEFWRR